MTNAVNPGQCDGGDRLGQLLLGSSPQHDKRATGTIIAPRIPCKIRINVNSVSVRAAPHNSEAT